MTLRDLVATALNKYHKWANRSMTLFLHDAELDPFVYPTMNQIKQARLAFFQQEQAISHANDVLGGMYEFHVPYGPISALKWHLQSLGFHLRENGTLQLEDRPDEVNIWNSSLEDVRDDVHFAWGRVVMTSMNKREEVNFSEDVDWTIVRSAIHSLQDKRTQHAMHTILTGAIATEKKYSHVNHGEDTCFCGQVDTFTINL